MRSTRRRTGAGIEVHRREPDDAVAAPRVVLVHGAMDRAASFGRCQRHLGDVVAERYDRRGYGDSRPLGVGGLDDHVADLLEVLDGSPAVVVGHSVGGVVALAAAVRAPELVPGLVLYEPPAPWAPWWREGWEPAPPGEEPGEAAERFLRRMLGDRTWERFGAAWQDERRAEGPALLADFAIGGTAVDDVEPDRVRAPTVVGCGDRSSARHRRAAEELAAELVDGRLAVLADADHGAHLTCPAAFAELVRRGLDRP